MGEALCQLEDYEQAKQFHIRAFKMRRRLFGMEHYEPLRSQSMIGEVLLRSGELDAAKETLTEALAGQEQFDPNPQAVSDTLLLLGETLLALEEMLAAHMHLSQAVSVRQDAFGPENSETAYAQLMLGVWYQANGDSVRAGDLIEPALATLTEAVEPTHPYLKRAQILISHGATTA